MLREMLAALTFPAGRSSRRLGHVRESVAIEARWRRCRTAWEPHLQQCRRAIADAAQGLGGVAVVLGSGALLDVPLDELARHFAEVWLIDAAHPRRARRVAARFPQVHLLEWDLLGLSGPDDLATAPGRLGDWRRQVPAPDLLVSVNLLTQLPLTPLLRWGDRLSDPEAWADAVMAAHLADLAAGPGRTLLLSEFCRRRLDRAGREIDREEPLAGLSLPQRQAAWEWELAPFGERAAGWRQVLDVGAYLLVATNTPSQSAPGGLASYSAMRSS